MIERLSKVSGGIAILFLVIGLHLSISIYSPYPFNKLNIAFAFLILYIMWKQSGRVVWYAFAIHFVLELFAATSFGIILFAATVALLLVYWIFVSVLTNKSWLTASLLGVFAILLYRFLYILVLFIVNVLAHQSTLGNVNWVSFLWELLLTAVLIAISVGLLHRFSRSFSAQLLDA